MRVLAAIMCAFIVVPPITSGQQGDLPVLPHASLLVGTAPLFLMVTTSQESWRLQPEYAQPESRDGAIIYPSISRDGKTVAYARLTASEPSARLTVSTYSITTDKHADYAEGAISGAVSISADASILAFIAVADGGNRHLHIVDLKTGKKTIGPQVSSSWPAIASWSPDSRRLAYSSDGEIRVWNTVTDKVLKIAEGDAPAWAPSGDWIAYLQGIHDPNFKRTIYKPGIWGARCLLVHPDGGGEKTLVELAHKANFPRFFVEPPVWSPDSSTILLNELADADKGTVNIHLVDVNTMRLKTPFKDSLRILGWGEAR